MKQDSVDSFLPLSPATLHILLALAGEKLHGYAIMQEIARQSEGRYKPGPGILYDNLQRLTMQGIVAAAGEDPEDPRARETLRTQTSEVTCHKLSLPDVPV